MSACTIVPLAPPEPTPAKTTTSKRQIETWLDQHQYDKALNALTNAVHRSPSEEVRTQIKQVMIRADGYDRTQAEAIERKHKLGDWEGAFRILRESLQNLPDGERLQALEKQLIHDQAKRLRQLEAQTLLAKAEWLLQSDSLYKEMSRTDPRHKPITDERTYIRSEILLTAKRLSAFGIKAYSNGDLDLAGRCLRMADRLHPSKENTAALERLDQLLAAQFYSAKRKIRLANEQKERAIYAQQKKQKQAEIHRTKKENKRLLIEAMKAFHENDLALARELETKIRGEENNPQLTKLRKSLNEAIDARVKSLLEKGNILYRDSRINLAKQTWEEALVLDPTNEEVKNRISRAERVLGNLKDILQKGSQSN